MHRRLADETGEGSEKSGPIVSRQFMKLLGRHMDVTDLKNLLEIGSIAVRQIQIDHPYVVANAKRSLSNPGRERIVVARCDQDRPGGYALQEIVVVVQ